MKNTRTQLTLILAGAVTFTMALWFYSKSEPIEVKELVVAGFVLIVVVFSLIIGIKRINDQKKGIPVEDELSLSVKRKAESKAFEFSFYLWTLILIFTIDTDINIEIPIGIGILGMGIIFIFFWIFYSRKGINDSK